MDADLANRDAPPTNDTPTPPDPLAPAAPPPAAAPPSSSTSGGGAPPQTTTQQKPKRPPTEETPEDKQRREHDVAVKALCVASAARGRNAREDIVLATNVEDPDL